MARLSEQERARRAREAVRGWERHPKRSELPQEVRRLPSRILASGLGQTLAFYASKGDEEVEAAVGAELARFLIDKPRCVDLLDHVATRCDLAEYRRLTREALAYAEWLKRYAAALLPKSEEGRSAGRS
ncbi:MAG: type III-B CRISPR module-associated protein Cmr5 [Armatimonadota bacterium]|nr:type III-B CRISPR module-associated protein Cmr5 [Armatimonadota bacterium]MDR7528726.1 type III-B CRISPR module-associated protein Cmr5 [Armatimonadota bacterium]